MPTAWTRDPNPRSGFTLAHDRDGISRADGSTASRTVVPVNARTRLALARPQTPQPTLTVTMAHR
jgi:hypothetical protein